MRLTQNITDNQSMMSVFCVQNCKHRGYATVIDWRMGKICSIWKRILSQYDK